MTFNRIDDVPVELEDEAERSIAALRASAVQAASRPTALPPSNEELIAICHAFLEQLRNGTAPWVVQRLNSTYGPMPADPSDFSFWMALVIYFPQNHSISEAFTPSLLGNVWTHLPAIEIETSHKTHTEVQIPSCSQILVTF